MTDTPLTLAEVVAELEQSLSSEKCSGLEGGGYRAGCIAAYRNALALLRRVAPEPTGEDTSLLDALEQAVLAGEACLFLPSACYKAAVEGGRDLRAALRKLLPATEEESGDQ